MVDPVLGLAQPPPQAAGLSSLGSYPIEDPIQTEREEEEGGSGGGDSPRREGVVRRRGREGSGFGVTVKTERVVQSATFPPMG